MSKLSKLKTEVAILKRATGVNDKGTEDSFNDIAVAVAEGEPGSRTEQEVYSCYTLDELIVVGFGKNPNNWPDWMRKKFGVV